MIMGMMKIPFIFVVCMVLFTTLDVMAVQYHAEDLTCCLFFYTNHLPMDRVVSFQLTGTPCPTNGVLFKMKNDRTLCVDPTQRWVRDIMAYVESGGQVKSSGPPEKPSVSVDPPGEVVEGRKVTLTCSSDANPALDSYTWYRDIRSISTSRQLVKNNVSPADSGQYFCQVKNTLGSQKSSPYYLDVQYGPKNVLLAVSPPGDVVKGSSVTFTCSSSGSNPPIQSSFIFKDRTIVAQKKIETIYNIQPSDSGTYYCQAMNNKATASSPEVTVDVHYPPEITSLTMDPPGEVVEGSKVTMTCRSDANPPVDIYTWYIGSRSISTGPQLVKDNVSPVDSGQYVCQGTNKHGSQRSSPYDLDVQYRPRYVLLAVSPPGDVVKGSSVTFTCSGRSNPPIQSYIIYKDRTIVAQKKIETISNIQPNDSGTYYCRAMNNIATASSPEVTVDVHYPPEITSVTMDPPGEVVEGSKVTLTYSSDANPPVDIYTWYRDNRSISTGPQLVKDNVSPADSGQYVCQGTNKHGSQRSSPYHLDVQSLFSQCGIPDPPDTSKITGGSHAGLGHHPWQVSLQHRDNTSSGPFHHKCGGVLIASCWVLTAAHCIKSFKDMQVVLGAVDLINHHEEHVQVIPVLRHIVHWEYRESTLSDGSTHNDVALLQLNVTDSPHCAVETCYVKTVCLPNQTFPDGKECVISGWGSTGEEKNKPKRILREAQVPLISKQSCMAVYGDLLDDTMICAGHMGGRVVDACQGDSGGPLKCVQDGIHYVAGLVSWGSSCPVPGASMTNDHKPGVYTDVHRYLDWINKNMSGDNVDNYDY